MASRAMQSSRAGQESEGETGPDLARQQAKGWIDRKEKVVALDGPRKQGPVRCARARAKRVSQVNADVLSHLRWHGPCAAGRRIASVGADALFNGDGVKLRGC